MRYLLLFSMFFSNYLYAQRESQLGKRELLVFFTEKLNCMEARRFLKNHPVDFTCSLKNSKKQMAYTVIYYGHESLGGIVEKISRLAVVEVATIKKRVALPRSKNEISEP